MQPRLFNMRLHATVIALAMVPLGLFALASYGKPQKPVVPIEQPTVLRAVKTDSFRAPVVTAEFKATPFTPVLVERPVVTEEARSIPASGPPPPQSVKKKTRLAYRSDDICTRHGMYRVNYGRRWRCRK
jgi:hypothetical protein